MLTVGLISMTIQAEERAKHPEQNMHILAEEMQRTIPSERPTPRWVAAIGHFMARLKQKTLHQPTVPAGCVDECACAHI